MSVFTNSFSIGLGVIAFGASLSDLVLDYQKGGGIKKSTYVDFAVTLGIATWTGFQPEVGVPLSIGYHAFKQTPKGDSLLKKVDKWKW